MKTHRLCATKLCALLALNGAFVTALATPPGGGTGPGDSGGQVNDLIVNPGIIVTASASACNDLPINATSPPLVIGTNVNVTFTIATGEYAGALPNPTGPNAIGITANKWEVTFEGEEPITQLICPISNICEYNSTSDKYKYIPYSFTIRIASTHFKNGDLKVSARAYCAVVYDAGQPTYAWTKPKEVTIKVYNKALVFATTEGAFNIRDSFGSVLWSGLATLNGNQQNTETTSAHVAALNAKTELKASESNHLILDNSRHPQGFGKSDILPLLKEATLLFTVTHGMSNGDIASADQGFRPSFGQLLYDHIYNASTNTYTVPSGAQITQQNSETIGLLRPSVGVPSEFNGAAFTGRTAPSKFNLLFFFSCNLGSIMSRTELPYAFQINDNSVDQAYVVHFGTLYVYIGPKDNGYNLDSFTTELLKELRTGTPIDEAVKILGRRGKGKYDWIVKGLFVMGDKLTRLSKVYLTEGERKDLTKDQINQWYYFK